MNTFDGIDEEARESLFSWPHLVCCAIILVFEFMPKPETAWATVSSIDTGTIVVIMLVTFAAMISFAAVREVNEL